MAHRWCGNNDAAQGKCYGCCVNRQHRRIQEDLMEVTGLSRSVFVKSHIRKLLTDNGIGYTKTECSVTLTLISRKQSQITNLKEKLAQTDKYIAKLTEENQALKNECELLRGRLFLLMQRQSLL